MATQQDNNVLAKDVFQKLSQARKAYVDRAIKNAKVTIPMLFREETDDGNKALDDLYSSIGARGVNNLTSKLMLALFPPNEKFFRLGLTPEMKAQLVGSEDKIAEVEQQLMQIEDTIIRSIEENQIRITIQEGILQLLVTGNCLLFLPPKENGSRLYNLHDYVVERDAIGNVLRIVARDKLTKRSLPQELLSMIDESTKDDTVLEVYTLIERMQDTFVSFQELNGKRVAGSDQTFPINKTPYIPIRMSKQDGEHYGRSFVEQYYGDLKELQNHGKALSFTSALMSKIIYLVNPNGMTRPRKLQEAKSGDFVDGRVEDVQALQTQKYNDLAVSKNYMDNIEQRLSFVFLISSAVQRNAERVTAEEVRMVARELEDTLGGVYAILTQELQLPLIRQLLAKLMSRGEVVQLPDGFIEPTITTGMEALGRGHDFNKYSTFMQVLNMVPNGVEFLKIPQLVTSLATAIGIDTQGLVKTTEEIQQEQEEAQAQQIGMQAVEGGLKGGRNE